MPELEFIISLASMLPHILHFPPFFNGSAGNIAAKLLLGGWEGFQLLPPRGITGHEWFCKPQYCRLKENAWNGVYTLGQVLRHEYGEAMEPSTLADWVIFPNPWLADQVFERLAGRHVSHKFGEDLESLLVEISPELELDASGIAKTAEAGGYGLVLDTQHALRDRRHGVGSPLGRTIEERIAAVDEYAHLVEAVHLKGVDDDHERVIERLLQSPRLKPRIIVVGEFIPNLQMSEAEAVSYANRFLGWAKYMFQST